MEMALLLVGFALVAGWWNSQPYAMQQKLGVAVFGFLLAIAIIYRDSL